MGKGFICKNCQRFVSTDIFIGTKYRNHCPYCLWSIHVDFDKSGDRGAKCMGLMVPIGLTFKHEGFDKYTGKPKQGEIMIIHKCLSCDHISINRVAADDNEENIVNLLSVDNDIQTKNMLKNQEIEPLTQREINEVRTQLFGRSD